MFKFKLMTLMLCLSLALPCTTVLAEATPTLDTSNPIHINYILNQVEDTLEDKLDKQYKIDWDFDIFYDNGVIKIVLEYDKEDAKAFKKLTKEQLSELLSGISKQVIDALGKEMPIEGIIKEDDTNKPVYTFMYKNGKVDIK